MQQAQNLNEVTDQPKAIATQTGFNGFVSVLITGVLVAGSAIVAGPIGVWVLAIVGSIWMWLDARGRDLKKQTGFASVRSPFVWFVAGLLLFVVAFPVYLTKIYKK